MLGIPFALQELLLHNFFCKFLDFHAFYNSFCLCFSCKFLHFSSALSSFMLQHTSQNTKSFWNNFECEETDFHSLLLFVLFRASHCFCINCLFFSKHPIHFMMASFFYIHKEVDIIHQWVGCILIFFIHPYVNVTIFLFILHHLCHVCYNMFQLSRIII